MVFIVVTENDKTSISTVLLNKTLINNINAINEKSASDLKTIINTYTESVIVQKR